jgi:ribosomal protein L11 methyltransferase
MKYYREFLVTAEPFNPEILSSLLWELDITGINEEVGCLKIFTSDDSKLTVDNISSQLEKLKAEKMISGYQIEENLFEEKNWNEEWEKSLNVIEINDKIVIKPTFREYKAKEGQIVIEIDPKMSFGTGDHQTTKLILILMPGYLKKGDVVLDAGSGTGILSIAAVKTGASRATAIDIDEWSYSNGFENAVLNNVSDKITFRISEIAELAEENFDIVFANIQKNVLITIADEIHNKLKEEGIVILSGLLTTDEEDIKKRYSSSGFTFIEKGIMDEWIALVFKKNM